MPKSDLTRGTYTGQFAFVPIESKEDSAPDLKPNGWAIGCRRFTTNGKCFGSGDPIRVREHQRVLCHILDASTTANIQLTLDGNPVPKTPTRRPLTPQQFRVSK